MRRTILLHLFCPALSVCLAFLAAAPVQAQNELLDAVVAGDAARVQKRLGQKADVNRRRQTPKPPKPKDPASIIKTLPPELFMTDGQLMMEMAKRYQTEHTELPLHAAVYLGHKKLVPLLLEAGADVNLKLSANGKSALHIAVERRQSDLVPLLLKHQADVEAHDKDGATPVHYAASRHHDHCIMLRALIQAGANLDAVDAKGQTVLHRIVLNSEGYEDALEIVLAHKINLNPVDEAGATPLQWAAQYGYPKLARRLLKAGARADTQDVNGYSPLEAALSRGFLDLAAELVQAGASVNRRDKSGQNLLHHVVGWHDPMSARFALRHKADMNAQDADGNTALHLAIGWNDDLLIFMLRAGADPQRKNKKRETAFDVAVKKHIYAAAKTLARHMKPAPKLDPLKIYGENSWQLRMYRDVKQALDQGASANGPTEKFFPDSKNPAPMLLSAMGKGHELLAELLLAKGADVHAKYANAETALQGAVNHGSWTTVKNLLDAKARPADAPRALHTACEKKRVEVARLLLEHGADPNAWSASFDGFTPLATAIRQGDADLVDVLLEHKADPNGKVNRRNVPAEMPPLVRAYAGGRRSIVERLLSHKDIDVNFGDHVGKNILHEAAGAGDLALAKRLLDMGAKVDAIERDYSTPLQGAILGNHLDVARLLVERGADVNLQPKTGRLPLHVAVHISLPLVEFLIQKGASAKGPDRRGSTPLHAAAESRATDAADIVRYLLKRGADVNAFDGGNNKDKTPLHCAVSAANEGVVRALLDAGADVQAVSPGSGHTALYLACCRGDVPMARLLLNKMARVNVVCGGETPLHRAVFVGPDLVALLLQYGADRAAKNSDGQTPLQIARDPKVIQLLRLPQQ